VWDDSSITSTECPGPRRWMRLARLLPEPATRSVRNQGLLTVGRPIQGALRRMDIAGARPARSEVIAAEMNEERRR